MNDIKNDKNLREAVNRREQQLPTLPDHLNERVMKDLMELEMAPKSRRLWWGYAAVAVAASIALLIVFNYRKQQSPQEPIVAQQMVKPAAVPSQPVVEESQPEVVPDEQPEARTVTELSEDVAQATEPASAENVKVPRHLSTQPILNITSPNDGLFFLASTSYMVTHKSYRDGLADKNIPDDGNDGGLSLYSAKDKGGMPEGWTDLKNWSNGQNVHRKLTKKERKQMAVLGAITAKRWHIDINTMNTMRYGSRTVTPDFFLELRGDTLRSYLPYLGQAQVSQYSPAIGLNFEEPVRQYKESKPKSNKFTQLDIDVKTREDSYHYVIELYDSGEATIRVRSQYRDPVSFDGTLEIE